ncbi:hypothetical protein H257_09066 [Aphanomyces astaci]|uniref:DDE Tnp4 domain-containing protein n=1 Tax=Aphanomyces astaci TaxID=112090 RepID=W4GBZ1_APHAT|nr:hypothetical protein H257_09066 [Aphanomyces astaci]ETV77180.1 hypothetical protein H257_09066 [Aphanomyces astaci]|eukprot:XP_009833486.1 hypothetical protein H257_09066 [Aphanomyces astaci]
MDDALVLCVAVAVAIEAVFSSTNGRSYRSPITNHFVWELVREGFEEHGFPNAYGAIDGSLIQVKRFDDFYGWYCRKGFPAFNMQAVVDHRMRFMSYSLRSGSQNDKALFNDSAFGQSCHTKVPPGGCFLGDAGYKLFAHVITPYSIVSHMDPKEANYNLVVERAFGRWKNKFRIFKHELLHHCPQDMARLIEVSLVLHNWYIDYDDDFVAPVEPEIYPRWMHIGGDLVNVDELYQVDGAAAKRARDTIKNYLHALL